MKYIYLIQILVIIVQVSIQAPTYQDNDTSSTGSFFYLNIPDNIQGTVFGANTTCFTTNCQSTIQSQILSQSQKAKVYNNTGCVSGYMGATICQNLTGLWSFPQNSTESLLHKYPSTLQSCPGLFVDYYTNNVISVCNDGSNTNMFAWNPNSSKTIGHETLLAEGFYTKQVIYQKGFIQLFGVQNQGSFVLVGTITTANTTKQYNQLGNYSTGNQSSFSLFDVSLGLSASQTNNPKFGYIYQNIVNSSWNIFQITLNQPTGTNTVKTIFGNLNLDYSISSTNTTAITFQIAETGKIFTYRTDFTPVQVIQSGKTYSNQSIDSQEVPLLAVFGQGLGIYGYGFEVNPTHVPPIDLECVYDTQDGLNGWDYLPAVTAVDDIVLVPFKNDSNLSYTVYGTGNPLIGGRGERACSKAQTIYVTSAITVQTDNVTDLLPAQILPTGQVITTSPSNQESFSFMLNDGYNVIITYKGETQSNSSVSIQFHNPNQKLTIYATFNTTTSLDYSYDRPSFNGLYFGLIFAGLIVLLGVLGALCYNSTFKARQQAMLL